MIVPDAWLQRLPSPVPVAWFSLFKRDPSAALDALLWESMYLDHDHPRERDDLLSNWVVLIDVADNFTALIDQGLAAWINHNWGRLRTDTSAAFQARVWSAVLHTLHLCSPNLPNAAQALLTHVPQRVDWLGRWSAGPGQDPLGAMLLALSGYQTTRQLAPLWQRMVRLPDGVPAHHAGIALEGVLQLPPENGQKPGVYRAEFARALADFAVAFNNRAQRGDMTEKIACTQWRRLQRVALMRMPFAQRWKDDIAMLLSLKDKSRWVIGGAPRDWLCGAFNLNDEAVGQHLSKLRKQGATQWNGKWPQWARELGEGRDVSIPSWLTDAGKLVGEQMRYAQSTGDTHACVRTLCWLSSRIRVQDPALAEQWARSAITLEPYNVVARTGLAEVLKQQGRLDESEAQYRDTIERFPDNVVARTGLAEVLKQQGRLPEAKLCYEQALKIDANNSYARLGLERLYSNASAVETNAVPPDGVQTGRQGMNISPELALRRRRMARHLELPVETPLSQFEAAGAQSDLSQAEAVFEALAANRLAPARDMLMAALNAFPYSAALLTAQARLERMEAQAAGTSLSEDAKRKVLAAPMHLRSKFPDLEPVYWLEHGLAYHALTDGQVRLDAVAESFDRIKQIAKKEVNPQDPDAVFKKNWAAGLIRLTGAPEDTQALSDRLTELGSKLDVREEEPVLRREAANRWQPSTV